MDDYPAELAPEFDEGGGVTTPFPEWWARVSVAFPEVPEDVAEQWLHRHWNLSPYGWMRSEDYTFQSVSWASVQLSDIASGVNDWDFANTLERGKYLVERCPNLWLVRYMREHHNIPRPLILLDNRRGVLAGEEQASVHQQRSPLTHILIEGHKRFELAAFLYSRAQLDDSIEAWVMEHVQDCAPTCE